MVQMAFCDLSHTFHKQVTNVSQPVVVILLWGILMSNIVIPIVEVYFHVILWNSLGLLALTHITTLYYPTQYHNRVPTEIVTFLKRFSSLSFNIQDF